MESLPFTMSAYEGFGVVEGRLRVSDEALHIEYHVKDNVFGAFKSDLRTIAIPLGQIEAVRYSAHRFRKPRLEVDVSDATLLEKIPGSRVGTLTVRLTREARRHADAVVQRIERRLTEYRLTQDHRDLTDRDMDFLFGEDDR